MDEHDKAVMALGEKLVASVQRDKLTRDERIRLEALNQACQLSSLEPASPDHIVIARAKNFEEYIRGNEGEGAPDVH